MESAVRLLVECLHLYNRGPASSECSGLGPSVVASFSSVFLHPLGMFLVTSLLCSEPQLRVSFHFGLLFCPHLPLDSDIFPAHLP